MSAADLVAAVRAELQRVEEMAAVLRRVVDFYDGYATTEKDVAAPKVKADGQMVMCPDCKALVKRRGLGVHRAKRHGKNAKPAQPVPAGVPKPKDRPMLAEPVVCPNCAQLTIVNPCARCHVKLPASVTR